MAGIYLFSVHSVSCTGLGILYALTHWNIYWTPIRRLYPGDQVVNRDGLLFTELTF